MVLVAHEKDVPPGLLAMEHVQPAAGWPGSDFQRRMHSGVGLSARR